MGSGSIDRYEILDELGSGTATHTYKARDPDAGDTVVIKELTPTLAADPQLAQRFLEAFRRSQDIRNPRFFARLRSSKQSGARLFTVRDYVEGSSLEQVLASGSAGLATPEHFEKLGKALCDAIRALAVVGIVHGGLSPRNVILGADGRIYVTDMGLSRVSLLGTVDSSYDQYALSFLAPEQIERGETTTKADIRAVGLILQNVLSAANPVLAGTPADTRQRALQEIPSPDPRLEEALARDPAARPEKTEQLKESLLAAPLIEDEPPQPEEPKVARPPTPPKTDPPVEPIQESEPLVYAVGKPMIQSIMYQRTGRPSWSSDVRIGQAHDFGYVLAGQKNQYEFEVVNSEQGAVTLRLGTNVPWATVEPSMIPLASGDRRGFKMTISGDHPEAGSVGELTGEWDGGKLALVVVRHRLSMRLGPVPKGTYERQITRAEPSCMLFLVDQSDSMQNPFGTDPSAGTRADGVARALNKLLQTLVIKCAKQDGVRDYFEIGVIGYGDTVRPVLGGALVGRELVRISEIANSARIQEETKKVPDHRNPGHFIEQKSKVPVWFEPVGAGRTPMCGAFSAAVEVLSKWVHEHRSSYPPIVVNITDGMATDGNPLYEVKRLWRIGTEDGGTLVFNCFISGESSQPILFPDSPDRLPTKYAQLLFKLSSPLPPRMRDVAEQDQNLRGNLSAESRGLAINANMATLITFLETGTKGPELR